LERLGRHNLVQPLQDGRWRVPPDLVAQLRARDESHPRTRVQLEEIARSLAVQAQERRPVWVDGIKPLAPFGFGAEIRQVQVQRAAMARVITERAAPAQALVNDEVDRHAAGERVARERGLSFLREAPAGFRGAAVVCSGKDGRQHVALLDEATGRLAMAPPGTLADTRGKVFEVLRRPDGTHYLQRRGLSQER
jgi:hypothetical protein